jgi:hypothetical protein
LDEYFTFETRIAILSGGNIGRTAHTEIIDTSSGIAGYVTFTIFFAPITNHYQQEGN